MSISTLLNSPSEHDFYQAVYTLQQQLSQGKSKHRKVGHDSIPKHELVRFKAAQHLGFPGQSISDISENGASDDAVSVDMLISFMGLTGPSGVLPQHYSELVLERLKLKDTGMKDFYDLFNHRLISLFYRAWEKYRFSVNFQHGDNSSPDAFSAVVKRLSGNGDNSLFYAGIFNKRVRSIDGLTAILKHFTQSDVVIKQFKGKWKKLAESDQTCLGAMYQPEGQFAQLGVDASIGSRVWDINSSIEIFIKPSRKHNLRKYKNRNTIVKSIKSLVKDYLGTRVQFKLFLEAEQGDVPVVQLSKNGIPLGMGAGLLSRNDSLSKAYFLPL